MAQSEQKVRDTMRRFVEAYVAAMPPENVDHAICCAINYGSVSLQSPTSNAKATYSLIIPENHGNNPQVRSVHGGVVSMVLDMLTSLTMLAVTQGWGHTGVSRNLNITFMRPAMMREKYVVDTEVLQVGKVVATIRGVMKRESDGMVIATCQHDKMRPADDRGKYFKL